MDEELTETTQTVEQLVAQCEEFILSNDTEDNVEELVEPSETTEQLLNQLDEWC